jgi:DNA-binding transcriptional LysR family regulator
MRRVGYALNEPVTAGAEINALRARDFLPAFFPAFMEANPNVRFDFKVASTPQFVEMLIEDRIEVLLAYDVPPQIGIRNHADIRWVGASRSVRRIR